MTSAPASTITARSSRSARPCCPATTTHADAQFVQLSVRLADVLRDRGETSLARGVLAEARDWSGAPRGGSRGRTPRRKNACASLSMPIATTGPSGASRGPDDLGDRRVPRAHPGEERLARVRRHRPRARRRRHPRRRAARGARLHVRIGDHVVRHAETRQRRARVRARPQHHREARRVRELEEARQVVRAAPRPLARRRLVDPPRHVGLDDRGPLRVDLREARRPPLRVDAPVVHRPGVERQAPGRLAGPIDD